jgi:uncharacterized membrane protein
MVKKKTEEKKVSSSSKIENEKLAAILTYFLAGIIWYFADEKMKKSTLVKFHTKQAINLCLISIIGNFIFGLIPIIGWFILMPIWGLLILILWIIGLINSINEKQKEIPIIGGFAEKYLTF